MRVLQLIVSSDVRIAVRTGVHRVFTLIHKERDEATAPATSHEDETNTQQPCQDTHFIMHICCHLLTNSSTHQMRSAN